MVGIDSAAGTEEVLRRASMETVARQRILALQNPDPAHFSHDDDGASHPTVGAGAPEDRIEAVAQRRLEMHRAAMALPGPNLFAVHHVACVSCSRAALACTLYSSMLRMHSGSVARMSAAICGSSGPGVAALARATAKLSCRYAW